jgi:hypothetical protein
VAASKNRLLWHEMQSSARAKIEQPAGGPVIAADNCAGGFSPGFASRLTLADRRRVFVKAMDIDEWPAQAAFHRAEAYVATALPADHPRLGGWADLAQDAARLARLPELSAWAANHLPTLIALEADGLVAAQGHRWCTSTCIPTTSC